MYQYTHVQRNGQRIYGGPPPDWEGSYPAKGSEIFVGKVPHDIFEDELVPIFEKVKLLPNSDESPFCYFTKISLKLDVSFLNIYLNI